MIEQIHATRIRMALETELGSAIADGQWIEPPCVSAGTSREIVSSANRSDVFRNQRDQRIICEDVALRTSHEIGSQFFKLIIDSLFSRASESVLQVDPEAVGKSWVMHAITEGGKHYLFRGMMIQELSVRMQESRIIDFEIGWVALQSQETAEPLPQASLSPTGGVLATYKGKAAGTTGEWDADPASSQGIKIFAAQIFIRRNSFPTQFEADGKPTAMSRAPWKISGEIAMPETQGITDLAYADQWMGKIAFFLGDDIEIRINSLAAFVMDDELKAYDFRTRRLIFEALSDDKRSVAEIRT